VDDNISGFFGPVSGYAQPDLGSFTLLHASEEGFSALYRGERAGRFRVYKCLKPQWRSSLLHETMLKKEFETGYSLRHPNICETCSYTDLPELGPAIEMEWVDGIPLDEYLLQGLPDERTFRRLSAELCDALYYLHSRQILHRDLKPSNIMVTHAGGHIKLIDFGLADRADSSVLKSPAGTRRFAAPEVLAGKPADVRSDIYALGLVLKGMTGRHKRVIDRCLQKNPDKRFASVSDVLEALRPQRGHWRAAIFLALLVALAALFFRLRFPEKDTLPAPPSVRDTVFVAVPKDMSAPPVRTQKKAPHGREEDPDRIFRAATDLFEGNL